MKVLVPLGTRPEIVKLAPVVQALRGRGADVQLVVTGQQGDVRMVDRFLHDFGLSPTRRDELTGSAHERFGALFANASAAIADLRPDVVVILGDTSTVPAFALAARRASVAVAHVEAGLRSYNPRSAEELHRQMAASLAGLHLAPTSLAEAALRREGVASARVHVVGNPAIDVLASHRVRRVPLTQRSGVLVTAHRATNVDDRFRLTKIVSIVTQLAQRVGKVTFPVHPRTLDRLEAHGLWADLNGPGIELVEPLPYDELLEVLAHSQVIVTDSGGIQEEASWFGVPVVILRCGTPRWEGVQARIATLAGLTDLRAVDQALHFTRPDEQTRVDALPCLYGDGHAAPRIADLLLGATVNNLSWWHIEEPDFRDCSPPWLLGE